MKEHERDMLLLDMAARLRVIEERLSTMAPNALRKDLQPRRPACATLSPPRPRTKTAEPFIIGQPRQCPQCAQLYTPRRAGDRSCAECQRNNGRKYGRLTHA